ncbi:hypothetical protein CWI42_080830 [Ordospora colligata]|uniref:J domain-containing protein n=1 Tax=Ordospora colligata OC4 TaxID=1354746 RepID=A0A0B2UJ41_9MICR|nr:uncharacterized protein M896_080830 [Ordospora colligata OC4]KHN69348.1 hypothetical protein M896_080830 [Ordospora colligata OC4]TBU14862.1 hypothetical protein CWI41_080820 [Ordospora colligata]TBU14993.1 hypothetical protein CWI40_080840 [Ordospora colligata]TBU18247.1 hypothetical protein CWI42_080830 [Ordospora colligata]
MHLLQRFTSSVKRLMNYPRGFKHTMDTEEAKLILDIEHSGQTVMQRYRTLIKINHPDRGGSSYIASKINQAKDLLIEQTLRHP